MSRNYPQMKIRISSELKLGIETSAKKNNRTMNAEITARLQASFEIQDVSYDQLLENITDIIEKAVKDK